MEFAFNNREHSTTKQSPFFLTYRLNPKAIPLLFPKTKVPSIQEWLLKKQRAQQEANAALDHSVAKMSLNIFKKFQPFEQGQKV